MLELYEICKSYRGPGGPVRALDGVSLRVGAGEFAVVHGPSGCGKTTLLLAAGALLTPDSGRVLVDGRDPYLMSVEERARLRATTTGFVFQQFHLIPYLTVLENVLAASLANPSRGARARAKQLLDQFGISSRARHLPADLSTGERQRAALARALLNGPRVLLADEPTGNLDPSNAAALLAYIASFTAAGGAALLATHSDTAKAHADQIMEMSEGRLFGAEVAGAETRQRAQE
ncbi:MAG: ATP-binding cassette domain-containing protein [Armatimonadetes bacterium]|nr:ATP-binding cassette domain-containing protein [Armatimonadota bacterium]